MSQPLPLLDAGHAATPHGRQTRAAARFHCIGSDCEDTCCGGMGVVIDRATYDKYRTCPDPVLKEVMDRVVVPDPQSVHDATYARIAAPHFCPFLTDQRLCAIQQRLGAGYLSRTCDTYPQALSRVDGVPERSLYLSCPEAARRVLLDPDAMLWDEVADPAWPPEAIPTLVTADAGVAGGPARHFHEVRTFVAALLRDRAYALWERLVILGMFCGQLDGLADASDVPESLQAFQEGVVNGLFRPALAGVGAHPGAQVDFLLQAFDHRLGTGGAAPRFVDSYWEFRAGIGYTPDATSEDAAAGYVTAHAQYFAPFMAHHPHILENYLLAAVGRSLFPVGPQTALYRDPKSCFEEFARLAVLYALVRSLLIGMAGFHKAAFAPAQVVRGVQAFAKSIEHDLPYQKALLVSLTDGGLADLPFLAVLLRDC